MFSRLLLSPFMVSIKPVLLGLILLGSLNLPAFSQRGSDPNLGHFYMGRQQWTIQDDSPIINNQTGTAPGAMNGALPSRPPLPKAGWQGYAPVENLKSTTNSPKTSGGQKIKSASSIKKGQKGSSGNLPKSSSGVNAYKPYATYSNPVNAPSAGANLNSTTHVKGSLLHWARRVLSSNS